MRNKTTVIVPVALIGGPHDGRVIEMVQPDKPGEPILFDMPGKVRHVYEPTGWTMWVLPGCKNAVKVHHYTHASSKGLDRV